MNVGTSSTSILNPRLDVNKREVIGLFWYCQLRYFVLIAPITQGGDFSRHAGFAVQLAGSGTKTQGAALVNQIRMLDLEGRGAKKIETAPDFVVEDALARLQSITD